MSIREDKLKIWLEEYLSSSEFEMTILAGDASFRRYFRVRYRDEVWVAMDAPPDKEDSHPFVAIAAALVKAGLSAPCVLASDLTQGFMLLSDLGDNTYLSVLSEAKVERYYQDAMSALITMQSIQDAPGYILPHYDAKRLHDEMALFETWFLQKHLQLVLTDTQRACIKHACDYLCQTALQQPTVFVHRDYHSRNLMVLPKANPGILDFQDAVIGPITYDLVSLLKDCYIDWPKAQVQSWALQFKHRVRLLDQVSDAQFLHWFTAMGMQRHMKAIGIFARLMHRDGKPGYLQDIPRTLQYLREAAAIDAALYEFSEFLGTL